MKVNIKNIGTLFLVAFFFISSISVVFAQNTYGSSFMEIGTNQKWFIPNNYETAMNPPACLLRNPNQDERKIMYDFCVGVNDQSVNCDSQIDDFLKLWEKNNCKNLGMEVKTLPDGSMRSYFPKKPSPTLTPSITPVRVSPTLQLSPKQPSVVDNFINSKRGFSYLELGVIVILITGFSLFIYYLFTRPKKH